MVEGNKSNFLFPLLEEHVACACRAPKARQAPMLGFIPTTTDFNFRPCEHPDLAQVY